MAGVLLKKCLRSIYTKMADIIRKLPPDLREIIYKKHLAKKIRYRTAFGWKEVHTEFSKQPFCHNR